MHYRNLLDAVKTAPHPDDISPTGVHVRYSIYYIHNATINSNCRSCVCRSQSQCRKEFKKLTSCSRDTAHTLLSHIHTAHTHPVHTYNSHTPTECAHTLSYFRHSRRLTPPRRSSVTCSITKQFLCLGQGGRGYGQTTTLRHKTLERVAAPAASSFFVWVILRVLLAFIGNDIWMFQSDTCDAAETDADSSTKSFFPFSPPSLVALPTASVLIVTLFRLRFRRIVTHFLRLPTVSQSLLLLPSGLTGVSSCPMCGLWTQLGHCDFCHWPHNLPLIAVLWPKFAACFMAANSWLAITNKNG